ncbi:MAG TPA: PilN domain-containing protein [Gammaproteobacteria bacterium]
MSQINLLPWREERRKELTARFMTHAVGIGIIAALIVFAARFHVGNHVAHHQSRNQYLQSEIDILNTKLQEIKDIEKTKANLLARMNVIQELQRSRPEIVHLFEELVTTLPEGVWLQSIKQNGKQLSIEGSAESNARVSAYMRNLEASAWLKGPVLEVIQADKDKRISLFKLRLQQESATGSEGDE